MSPERIQRRRAKGWRMPKGVIYVGRGSKWGNPFVIGPGTTRADSVDLYAKLMGGYICLTKQPSIEEQKTALQYAIKNIRKLKGKNLACWCPLDKPCHADLLLEVANK